ncbi:hypothetical protein Trydic_g16584 [Trypoxylus dichotomus]
MKCMTGTVDDNKAADVISKHDPIILINKNPKIVVTGIDDPNNPLIEECAISPKYIGNAVNAIPSAIPAKNLAPCNTPTHFEYATKIHAIKYSGDVVSIHILLPILSTKYAAEQQPTTAPMQGITASHDPSELDMGICDFSSSSNGKEGDGHPKCIPVHTIVMEPARK